MAVTPEALRHFISVIDGSPCTPPQPACGACKSVWFCTCRHQEHPFDWAEIAMRAPRQTMEPRPMPTPLVATANQKHLLEDQSVRQCKRSRKSEPPLLACNREAETRLHLCLPTQQSSVGKRWKTCYHQRYCIHVLEPCMQYLKLAGMIANSMSSCHLPKIICSMASVSLTRSRGGVASKLE